MTYVLISYDISDDKKRTRVAGLLKDHGKRVQYSVFECHLDADRLNDLVVGLDRFAEGDDSIRIYPICRSCLKRAVILGRCESFDEDTFYVV
ncbi:MAG: CRISPR-associated endonuclease Cas2 [Candidatus Syntropharchaeales archaeon]